MEDSENITQNNQIQNNYQNNNVHNATHPQNTQNNLINESSLSPIKIDDEKDQLDVNLSTSHKTHKENEIQIEFDKSKNSKKYITNNYSISPSYKNNKNINNHININKVVKPFFTSKHILLKKFSLKEVNECIYKDYNQLANILPYYQNYFFQNKINNYRNYNYNINNNSNNNNDVVLICLNYIEYTNFFFNRDITYKVQNLLFNIINGDRQILEQNKYNYLKNRFNEVYNKLIPFQIRCNYLKAFYDRNPDKNLSYLFKKDLDKMNVAKHIDIKIINYLYEIFENVKQKMETKKESIKLYLNKLFNLSNNNNSNINKNIGDYNYIENLKNNMNDTDINFNNHYNSFYPRKHSYQYSSNQNNNISSYKNLSNNKGNYMNINNRKNNDIINKEVSQFNINNYNKENNFKQNYSNNRHNYFYKNNNHKTNNNNDRDYLRNKNNKSTTFYKHELVEIEDVKNNSNFEKEANIEENNISKDDINEEEYKNLKINNIETDNINNQKINDNMENETEKEDDKIINNEINNNNIEDIDNNNDYYLLDNTNSIYMNDKGNGIPNDDNNEDNIILNEVRDNEEEDKKVSNNININSANEELKESDDNKINENYSDNAENNINNNSYDFLYDSNKKVNNKKKMNSDTALQKVTYNDINSPSNSINADKNKNNSYSQNKQNKKNINNLNNNSDKNNNINEVSNNNINNINHIGLSNYELTQMLRLIVFNQNNLMEKINQYAFQFNQMNNNNILQYNNIYTLNMYNFGVKNYLNSYNPYNNKNYNFYNNPYSLNKQEKMIESDYLKLKKLEENNPDEIKNNINLFENNILLPIYHEINSNNNNSEIISLYSRIYSKYKEAINSVLDKNNLKDTIVEPYGSVVNNFLTSGGDIDISIVPNNISKDGFIKYLQEIEEYLINEKTYATQNNIYINSRYALLSLTDIETNINIDITVHNLLPITNSKMLRLYSLYDQRFHILGLFLKHWVKINNIKGAPNGFLSSYALLLLIIHFLQSVTAPKVLPILQEIKNVNKEYKYFNGDKELTTNLYFEENFENIKEYMNIINGGNENNLNTTELLVQFFEYYSYKYNMNNHYLISIKHSNKILVNNNEQIVFPIEDPFDVSHNPGKSLKYNTQQHSEFILCMKKEINNILSGEYFKHNNY